MPDLIIKNISKLVTPTGTAGTPGNRMNELRIVDHAMIAIADGKIAYAGETHDYTGSPDAKKVIDADGMIALPGFVDSHTHLVFAGNRAEEFDLRSRGKSYAEIAESGGGIKSTVKATRKATKDELHSLAKKRLAECIGLGTTTIEIKSGYGLEGAAEMKMLEVIGQLHDESPATVVATFLGAHDLPEEVHGSRQEYLSLIFHDMFPRIWPKRMAKYCDVFCEEGYFSPQDARQLFAKARDFGMKPKVHADQLSDFGGVSLAAEVKAISADHLEFASDEGLDAMREAGTVATLLPGAAYQLNMDFPDARRFVSKDLVVALASDYNPGSSTTGNMQLMMNMACCRMNMSCAEALTAATLNGAAALELADVTGSLQSGKRADVILCELEEWQEIIYRFGHNPVKKVIAGGAVVS
ncbi:MAG: imidazolonepropionase [Planctomycetes bacterium]|nr:imidazolonepropionase [Planctomycetota bacterium]